MLRKGKTKSLLESAIDSALLAVEVYNKPRTTFRSEAYITLMIIAWTRLLHANFNNTIGQRYFYKKGSRYEIVDGERKAWELTTCIKKLGTLPKPVEKNLEFFIKLRNKIEHRHIEGREVDTRIFGEAQSLLYNFETTLIGFFGQEYCLNEALVYSLQFSHLRTQNQKIANKSALSKDLSDLVAFIDKYKTNLDEKIYNSQEFSIKLLQIPKISNTDRTDTAIEFVRWDELDAEDKKLYDQVAVLVKDKKINVAVANVKRFKTAEIMEKVNAGQNVVNLTQNLHVVLYKLFSIRPKNGADDPFETNATYCLYDETHKDYVYEEAWANILIHFLQTTELTPAQLRKKLAKEESINIEEFEL